MSHAFRSLALAAALTVLVPVAAQASVVTTPTGFSAVGNYTLVSDATHNGDVLSTLLTTGSGSITVEGAKIRVTNDYTAMVYATSQVMTINFNGVNVNGLTFHRFAGSAIQVFVKLHGATDFIAAQDLEATPSNNNGDLQWADTTLTRECQSGVGCTTPLLSDAPDQFVEAIKFTGGGFIGVNDLQFLIADNGNGHNVPEPASYALAALALVGAGAASRRRSSR